MKVHTRLVLLALFLSCTFFITTESHIDHHKHLCSGYYDYLDALTKSLIFFEGQRSGKLPSTQRVRWRGDSALLDGSLDPDDVDLVGGYYDAGDNVKFTWPMAFSTTLLSWAAIEHQWELNSTDQLIYLQSAILWGTNFLLKAHDSASTIYAQVGDGTVDHNCWERPEDMDTPRTVYKVTKECPGSEVAAEVAAALAATSIVFKHVRPRYSSRCLHQAKMAFLLADKYRGSFQGSCPFYCSYSGYEDELLWAAAWLYKATGDKLYSNYLYSNQAWSFPVSEFSWDTKLPGVQALLAKEFLEGKTQFHNFKVDADSFVCAIMPGSDSRVVKTTPGGLLFTRDECNMQYVTSAAMVLLYYSNSLRVHNQAVQCGHRTFSPAELTDFAQSQVDYILGNNPLKMSYMVGFGNKYPMQLHHRGASISSIRVSPDKVGCTNEWYSSAQPNPNVHIGALVGGPSEDDQFRDKRWDHGHLEPTTYMNAAFVGAAASLLSQVRQECSLILPHQINVDNDESVNVN